MILGMSWLYSGVKLGHGLSLGFIQALSHDLDDLLALLGS